MKFNNKKTEIDGTIFDSKMESDYYLHLLELQKQGVVTDIQLQPRYLLLPAFPKMGRTIRKIEYIADFLVTYQDGKQVVIDVKGAETDVFKLKAKFFDYYYPDFELQIITKHKEEWIPLKDKKRSGGANGRKRNSLLPKRKKKAVRPVRKV